MSIFGTIGKAVGLGAAKQVGRAVGVLPSATASGLGLSKMPGSNVQGGMGGSGGRGFTGMIGRVLAAKRGMIPGAPPAAGVPGAPPPPMAGAPPRPGQEAMAQGGGEMTPMGGGAPFKASPWGGGAGAASAPGAMQQMGQAGPPPQPFLESVQQAIAPSEFSDPYEAQKQRRIRGY